MRRTYPRLKAQIKALEENVQYWRRKFIEIEQLKKDETTKLQNELFTLREILTSNYEEIKWLRSLLELIVVPVEKEKAIAEIIRKHNQGGL